MYAKSKIPTHNLGQPTNVTVQVLVKKISDVKENELSYNIKYDFLVRWRDQRLNWSEQDEHVLDSEWYISPDIFYFKLWRPKLILHNCDEAEIVSVLSTKIDRKGNVLVNSKMEATCYCPMDLSHYPMDTQYCPMILESYVYPSKQVSLQWHQHDTLSQQNTGISGYSLVDMVHEKRVERITRGDVTDYYDRLIVTFVVRRTFLYFLYRTYIPIMLVMILNMGSYWIPHTAIPARICLIGTTFLTNVFILQGVTEQTVRVDVTTSLQMFVLVNIVMVVVALLQYIAVLHLVSNISTKKVPLLERQTLRELNFVHERSRNATHKLDSVFRVAAPVAYFVFCALYFAHYLQ